MFNTLSKLSVSEVVSDLTLVLRESATTLTFL